MKIASFALAIGICAFGVSAGNAATFSPSFDAPPFPGSQYDVTSTENLYYAANYGITVSNAYLYVDDRDTFDGVGVASGEVAEIGSPQDGRIDFLDTTDFVVIDFLAIYPSDYSAFDSAGNLLSSFTSSGGVGTETLSGGIISYILFSGRGGYTTISGLTYNYDGVTDGQNDDLPGVPLPAGGLLLLGGLGALAGLRRRRG